jgi:ketosteroid isomerase-like protein
VGHKETYEAISQAVLSGDYERIRGYVADEFVLSEPAPLPYGGEYRGPQGFVDLVYGIRKWYDVDVVKTELTEAEGDLLVCEFVFGFTSRRTGERLEAACVDLFRFDDEGRFLRGDVYYEDPAKLASIA